MTKKDYIAIAACIAETKMALDLESDNPVLKSVTSELMRVCAADNPRFDRARFLRACGL